MIVILLFVLLAGAIGGATELFKRVFWGLTKLKPSFARQQSQMINTIIPFAISLFGLVVRPDVYVEVASAFGATSSEWSVFVALFAGALSAVVYRAAKKVFEK